jgi:transposase
VREKFTCRSCETITQPPAPFHTIPRAWAGPSLLATILFEKFGQHQPLNRQCERFAREGVDLSLSTLADQVGTCAALLKPLLTLMEAHVIAAERLHGDDTPVPVLAKGQTDTARAWVYVRDDRPFSGPAPPAAVFYYSRDRSGEHAEQHLSGFAGILQADAFAGYNRLYGADRQPGPITAVSCWAHARRKFFVLADIAANAKRGQDAPPISPLALEAVKRIDALFDIERAINGKSPEQRLAARQEHSAPRVTVATLINLQRQLIDGGYRRSSPDDANIVREERHEDPFDAGTAGHSQPPAQHSLRLREAAGNQPDRTRHGGRAVGPPPDGGCGRCGGGAS